MLKRATNRAEASAMEQLAELHWRRNFGVLYLKSLLLGTEGLLGTCLDTNIAINKALPMEEQDVAVSVLSDVLDLIKGKQPVEAKVRWATHTGQVRQYDRRGRRTMDMEGCERIGYSNQFKWHADKQSKCSRCGFLFPVRNLHLKGEIRLPIVAFDQPRFTSGTLNQEVIDAYLERTRTYEHPIDACPDCKHNVREQTITPKDHPMFLFINHQNHHVYQDGQSTEISIEAASECNMVVFNEKTYRLIGKTTHNATLPSIPFI